MGIEAQPITAPADLLKFPLLRLDDWSTWARWFEAAGVTDSAGHGAVLGSASMLIDAAVNGQGVALARTALAAWDIINGRLVRPIDISFKIVQHVLDRLPEGSVKHTEDCYFPKMAVGRGGRGRTPPGDSRLIDDAGRHYRNVQQRRDCVVSSH